ncbi:hypothetical protein [Cerasicoccus fimbriatus]|uniref:hypothetical protein n=1 Tax=Cerasicoccus fimbriatus TaxID=3014554 RepID=UPI0022B4DE4D|nr:hypothetical protein [Cerasicoccus sp. TK19100]
MAKLLSVFSSIVAVALFLVGCENVDVDSSSAGNAKLAASSSAYIEPDFPETDGYPAPHERVDNAIHEAIANVLTAKGYHVTQDKSSADIVISGSYEQGKVVNQSSATSANNSVGYSDSSMHVQRALYVFLSASKDGEKLWSANEPLSTNALDAGVQTLMASFPTAGK